MKQLPTKLLRLLDDLFLVTISIGEIDDNYDPSLNIECFFMAEDKGKFFIYHDFIGAN